MAQVGDNINGVFKPESYLGEGDFAFTIKGTFTE